jgi:phosphatidylinositol-3,4,5-trisphosphate 3-phosphatase and dual-specificity protein phosphatase PTEN
MGWFWFIPTFHMTHPRTVASDPTVFRLTRKEIDFPLGVGSYIVDVTVAMEWCPQDADGASPPRRQDSEDSKEGKGEPTGLGAALNAAAMGDTQEAVDATAVGNE